MQLDILQTSNLSRSEIFLKEVIFSSPLVGVIVVLLNSDPLLGYKDIYRSEISVASGREVALTIQMNSILPRPKMWSNGT